MQATSFDQYIYIYAYVYIHIYISGVNGKQFCATRALPGILTTALGMMASMDDCLNKHGPCPEPHASTVMFEDVLLVSPQHAHGRLFRRDRAWKDTSGQ